MRDLSSSKQNFQTISSLILEAARTRSTFEVKPVFLHDDTPAFELMIPTFDAIWRGQSWRFLEKIFFTLYKDHLRLSKLVDEYDYTPNVNTRGLTFPTLGDSTRVCVMPQACLPQFYVFHKFLLSDRIQPKLVTYLKAVVEDFVECINPALIRKGNDSARMMIILT